MAVRVKSTNDIDDQHRGPDIARHLIGCEILIIGGQSSAFEVIVNNKGSQGGLISNRIRQRLSWERGISPTPGTTCFHVKVDRDEEILEALMEIFPDLE